MDEIAETFIPGKTIADRGEGWTDGFANPARKTRKAKAAAQAKAAKAAKL